MVAKGHTKKLLPRERVEVTDSSGWTHVINGRRNVRKVYNPSPQLNALRSVDKTPLKQLVEDHARYVDLWERSECWQNVANILQDHVLSNPRIRLTKCVCLGLGSLSAGQASSKHEMAALDTILRLLGKTHVIEQVIFQDPAFNDVDEAFLIGMGYHTVSTPAGFESIDEHTFCFAPHLEHAVFALALKHAHPALCIGNSDILADPPLQSSAVHSKDVLEVFQPFSEVTRSKMMPDFQRDTWCQFTSIYWLHHHAE